MAWARRGHQMGFSWRLRIDMLQHRNLLSHTYDSRVFDDAVIALRDRYLPAMESLHAWLLERALP